MSRAAHQCSILLPPEVLVLRSKFLDLLGQEVSAVSDRIVVEHAGEFCRTKDSFDVRFHFAPIAAINVWRQHHQAAASDVRARSASSRFGRAQRRDRSDHRHSISDGFDDSGPDRELLIELSVALSPNEPGVTIPVQP